MILKKVRICFVCQHLTYGKSCDICKGPTTKVKDCPRCGSDASAIAEPSMDFMTSEVYCLECDRYWWPEEADYDIKGGTHNV